MKDYQRQDSTCACCGMTCAPLEFHPFAACLMFRACGDGTKVTANLAFVVEYGKNLAQHREDQLKTDKP